VYHPSKLKKANSSAMLKMQYMAATSGASHAARGARGRLRHMARVKIAVAGEGIPTEE
jgi:hypothetical protein